MARTCASIVEPRMKFTTGSPKPRFAKAVPVMVKLAGGVARSTTSGLIALTLGTRGVSGTASTRVARRLYGPLAACAYTLETSASTGWQVGHGGKSVVTPVKEVARSRA